jgi:hypothetical protein
MANIVGEPLLPYVVDQINTRQKVLGKSLRTSSDITWMNSKTSWVQLASSVNISSQDIAVPTVNGETLIVNDSGSNFRQKFIGLDGQNYGGNRLARELVLQGGSLIVTGSEGTNLRFGISQTNSILPSNPSAYGLGGTEFGLKPMPGITTFSLKTYNNGTLREATLEILAHNRKQFEYIDSLYLRLGYTMFVEWGNSSFPQSINNDGIATYANSTEVATYSLVREFLTRTPGADYTGIIQNKVENNRTSSKGNYDGFIGQVKNFDWEFGTDGTYKITLILISAGSVIESLKINPQVEGITQTPPTGSSLSDSTRYSALNTFIQLATTPDTKIVGDKTINLPTKDKLTEDQQKSLGLPESPSAVVGSRPPVMSCNIAYGTENSKLCYYLRFGDLLNFINKKLLTYDKDGNPNLISIDINTDTYVYSNGWSFSSDPTKLIVGFSQQFKTATKEYKLNFFKGEGAPQINQFHDEKSGKKVGRLMNVYLERTYLQNLVESNQDPEDGGVYLDKFLNSIIGDINTCLGGINKIKQRVTFVTEEVNGTKVTLEKIQFYDEIPVYGVLPSNEPNYNLNIYGFNSNEGSFVTNYNLKTEISKRLQTQIAIGAQAGGQAVGYDSTAISKWNVGLVDRIKPNKLDIDQFENAQKTNASNYISFKNLQAQYISYLEKLEGIATNTDFDTTTFLEDFQINTARTLPGVTLGIGNILNFFDDTGEGVGYVAPNLSLNSTDGENSWNGFQTVQSTFFSKVLAADAIAKDTPSPFIGFLPINFSVTLDGLSGVRIFDKLIVNSRALPPNYGNTLEFVITGVDHNFEGNKWTTTLQTTSIPKVTKEVQVNLVDLSDIISESLESNLSPTNNTDSYFSLRNIYVPFTTGQTGPVVGGVNTITKNKVTPEEIVSYMNPDPQIRDKFLTFFNSILQSDAFKKGFRFQINDIGRPLYASYGVGISSAHNYFVAIDMTVYDAQTGSQILGGINATMADPQRDVLVAKWQESGLVALATQAGLEWGGLYKSGSYRKDVQHFTALKNWASQAPNIRTTLRSVLPKVPSLIEQAKGGNARAKALLVNVNLREFLKLDANGQFIGGGKIGFGGNVTLADFQTGTSTGSF